MAALALIGTPALAWADTTDTSDTTAASTEAPDTTTPATTVAGSTDTTSPGTLAPPASNSATTTTPASSKSATTGQPSVPTGGASGSTVAVPSAAAISIETEVGSDLAQLAAISAYQQAQLQEANNQTEYQEAVSGLASEQQADAVAVAAQGSAQANQAAASSHLAQLALAAYTGEATVTVGPATGSSRPAPVSPLQLTGNNISDTNIMLGVVFTDVTDQLQEADRTLSQRNADLVQDANELAAGRAAVSQSAAAIMAGQQTVATDGVIAANPGSSGPVDLTILGPATLTATELAGWFASTGYTANTTVPMAQLAADYVTASLQTGVRGDVAFAQSIIETGYFSFPAGGQLVSADNNFAGIGACDSCATGWSFPDAQTGVSAQAQLLEKYASTTPVSTPLIPGAGIGGCCSTWMALSGTWASDETYGVQILTIYQDILAWAIPARVTAAGL